MGCQGPMELVIMEPLYSNKIILGFILLFQQLHNLYKQIHQDHHLDQVQAPLRNLVAAIKPFLLKLLLAEKVSNCKKSMCQKILSFLPKTKLLLVSQTFCTKFYKKARKSEEKKRHIQKLITNKKSTFFCHILMKLFKNDYLMT